MTSSFRKLYLNDRIRNRIRKMAAFFLLTTFLVLANYLADDLQVRREKAQVLQVDKSPQQATRSLSSENQKFVYHWKLRDLYQKDDFDLVEKSSQDVRLAKAISFRAPPELGEGPVFIQHSRWPDFRDAQIVELKDGGLSFEASQEGDFFFRYSLDGETFGPTAVATVKGEIRQDVLVKTLTPDRELRLNFGFAETEIRFQAQGEALGYIIEATPAADKAREIKRLFWVPQGRLTLKLTEEGLHAYRARAVLANEELTDWSTPVKVQVGPERPLLAPDWLQKELKIASSREARLNWSMDQRSSGFELEIRMPNGLLVDRLHADTNSVTWEPPAGGEYRARVRAFDQKGSASDFSREMRILIPYQSLGSHREGENSFQAKTKALRDERDEKRNLTVIEEKDPVSDLFPDAPLQIRVTPFEQELRSRRPADITNKKSE